MNDDGNSPGTGLVPASRERSTEVLGTLEMVGGELVVRVRPQQAPRDVTVRPVGARPDPTTLAHIPWMRYVGPRTPQERAQFWVEVARWEARPWWRRWATEVADWCWRRWRS